MLERGWLRVVILLANLTVVLAVLERRSVGPRSPYSGENPSLTALYDFFDIPGAFFVVAALGLAVGVADIVQRMLTDRPMFGPDGRHAALAVQVIAPAPFAIAFSVILVVQLAMFAIAMAGILFGVWLIAQVLSG